MTVSATLRVGIYCRVSTEGQSREDRYSLSEQSDECRKHAAREGWLVVESLVVCEVVSAFKPVRERPLLDRLLTALEDGKIDAVLFHDPDRLCRNQTVLGIVLDRVEAAEQRHGQIGQRLRFVTGDYDQDATGKFVLGARVFAAELQRERTMEATTRGKRGKARAGLPAGWAPPPYGLAYADVKRRYVVDEARPDRIAHVRWMFEAADQGLSLRAIGRGLESQGALPPYHGRPDKRSPTGFNRSTRWVGSTVYGILTNPNYVGRGWYGNTQTVIRPGRQGRTDGRTVRTTVPRDAGDPLRIALPEGVYPVVVAPELFSRVQARLAGNKAESQRLDRDPHVAVFRRGHAICGGCFHPLAVKPGKGGLQYTCNAQGRWHCPEPAAIQVATLDDAAWALVQGVLEHPELIAERVARLATEDTTGPELEHLDKHLVELDRRGRRLVNAVAKLDDDDAIQPLLTALTKVAEERRGTEARRNELLAQRSARDEEDARIQSALDYTARVREEVAGLGWDGKRQALKRLGARVILRKAGLLPRWLVSLAWHPQEVLSESPGGVRIHGITDFAGSYQRWTPVRQMADFHIMFPIS